MALTLGGAQRTHPYTSEAIVEHGILIVAGLVAFVWCAIYGSQCETGAWGPPRTDSQLFGSFLEPL